MYKFFNPIQDPKMIGLDEGLMKMLDAARYNANIPFVITSGLRTPAENAACGGVNDSSHLTGLAADILCENDTDRYLIVNGAVQAGFKRIGLGNQHVHLDIDTSKPQNILWVENE